MGLTERIQVLVSPEMRKQLEERAQAEGASVGALIRQFAEGGLGLPPSAERLRALKRLCAMELPVADWEQMERETAAGRFADAKPA